MQSQDFARIFFKTSIQYLHEVFIKQQFASVHSLSIETLMESYSGRLIKVGLEGRGEDKTHGHKVTKIQRMSLSSSRESTISSKDIHQLQSDKILTTEKHFKLKET